MCLRGDEAVAKLCRTKLRRMGLLSALALPMTVAASASGAEPWLERSNAIAKPWDLPFIGDAPQKRSRNTRLDTRTNSKTGSKTQATSATAGWPAEDNTAGHDADSNVFPPPRPPMVAPPPAADEAVTAQTETVGKPSREPAAVARDRSRQAAPAPVPAVAGDRKQPATDRKQQTA